MTRRVRRRGGWMPILCWSLVLVLAGCGGKTPTIKTTAAPDQLHVSCVSDLERMSCGGDRVGFYYDYRDDRCKPMQYGACTARAPFKTREECMTFCGANP
ncbi:hypothetical protein CKO25_07900 [Thiocapsa imhoffii]|uniref:BPTI/Kunitz inhibitor domain-containing protein n=2 Tax=Thiocapsa imhoffii TaxID=382777 RepID=A0A9X0WI69_9GAMM|nr:hypothetical protein [Thiocapsa imhoffii]